MTVAQKQVVRHGRSVRIYVPVEDRHRLADRQGNLAATVTTSGLYRWFAEPDLVGLTKPKEAAVGQVKTWRQALGDLRELEERINAKARWIASGSSPADEALRHASEQLDQVRIRFQTRLVAASDLLANGDQSGNLVVLQAELRMDEREIDVLKTDVRALTVLTREETRMSIADQIGRGLVDRRDDDARREAAAQRARDVNQADDRGTPGHQVSENSEAAAQDAREEDQRSDRGDEGGDGLSLGERIEAEVQRRRTARSTDLNTPPEHGRSR